MVGDCLSSVCKALGSIPSMEEGGEKLACVFSSKMNYYCPVRIGILYLIDCVIKKEKKTTKK